MALRPLWDMNDLKFAFCQLLKNPGFTAVAVFTLALGIGANTAVFSVVNGLLLRPLPYRDSERLAIIWTHSPGASRGRGAFGASYPARRDWLRAFDRLRECGEPAPGARGGAGKRDRHSHGHWRKPLAGHATAFNGKPGPGASRWRAGTAFEKSGAQSFARAQSGQYPSIARDQHGRTCADFHVGSGVAHEPSVFSHSQMESKSPPSEQGPWGLPTR